MGGAMKPMLLQDICERIGAAYTGDPEAAVTAISTDTRALPRGCLFVALSGDKFDGNDYVGEALKQGAAWAVAERLPEGCPRERVLPVKDTRAALLEIAGLYRSSLDVKVVAITGSVGKTTTKEMVACVMEAAFPTLKTQQNLNNEIGLSQTILQLTEEHRVAVLELGMDGPGQIAPLSRCAAPDIAIVTNIGVSHLQKMGSREAILEEKLSIAEGLREGGVLLLNGDDSLLSARRGITCRVKRYGTAGLDAEVRAERIKEYSTYTTFEILYNDKRFEARIPCMGRHNVGNALAAFLAGTLLGVPPEPAIAALEGYQPAGMRQRVVTHGELTVVEDCYNASPDSMRAAMNTLGALDCRGKRIAVLSDMLELGALEEQAHLDVGTLIAGLGIDRLLCAGPLSRRYAEGAQAGGMGNARYFPDQEELWQYLKEILAPGDVVWFKASRGMHLEDLIQKVYKEYPIL